MIITNEVLSQFIQIDEIDKEILAKTLNNIGLEVEGQYHIKIPKKVVVAKVLKKSQHPNADKLSICEVDIGKEVLQIVCGARNVNANQFVALALDGAILPSVKSDSKDDVVISNSEIRGVKSCGMICSSTEIGLPKINDGIMELDSSIGELILGKELCEYPFFNQFVMELSITPNRGDCLSVLGVARDIASVFNLIVKNIIPREPSTALGVGRFLQVVPNGDLRSSLMYRIVQIKESYTPLFISLTLAIVGRYKDDFVADMLEYASYMSGVIFNAYPMDSKHISHNATEAKLIIKKNEDDLESVYSEIKKDTNLCDLHLLNIIGATSYSQETHDYPRTFILEASFIDAEEIASKVYDKDKSGFDDNVLHRSTHGSNPDLELGMNVLCSTLNLLDVALYSGTHEISRGAEPINIQVTFSYICDCIGNEISKEEIAFILKRLNFKIQATCDDNFFIVQPPSFRNDIKNSQDVVEEVLRLYGIDKVVPKNLIISPIKQDNSAYVEYLHIRDLRKKALSHGYMECIHYIFDNLTKLKELGFETLNPSKDLLNPITIELNTLRPSLLPHLLESVIKNKQLGYEVVKLFEIGYVYDSNREPLLRLAFMISDYEISPSYPNPKGINLSFYSFARQISSIIGNFSCTNVSPLFITNKLIHPYQSGNIVKDDISLGIISKLNPNIAKQYKLDCVFFCEIDVKALFAKINHHNKAREFSRFQVNKRDITIVIDKSISFNAIRKEIDNVISQHNITIIKALYPLDVFEHLGFDSHLHALSIRFIFQSMLETLNESQMQDVLDKILDALKNKFRAELRL
ncbi:phenylalanine--tRNA ligase subunit beta [Helicobacter muridarum]|uniref:Phenylalanine--tRNA ligase beta subunit n=1 Tax=Helicobacter muridarum TaxID=216 RepID=A0A099TXT6_9HELI|nr:phenylalanine--tRNA ligase subunit beta [Helicobacter muridarum]TLE01123.1 phenylalanine--tRNA ligase subunit beta [Helicobacter muridarum]STQ85990.1 phenylalanyl-tRNA synthetase subunit beta [Helicobacter muridarum]